jgi:hypothetical protein
MLRIWTFALALTLCVSCGDKRSPDIVVVHVLRDPSAPFADKLRRAESQFGLTETRLANGKKVIVATNEGDSYPKLVQRIGDMSPDVVIPDDESDIPSEVSARSLFLNSGAACGAKLVYVTTSASEEQIEAAKLYVRFLQTHCDGSEH